MFAKRVSLVATFALALLTGAHAGQDERAAEMLRKSMGRRFPVNVVAVIVQRDPNGDGTYRRVKVARARDGRARHTVLQPLRMAGVESVDDGENMRVYLPDKRTLIVQDSAHSVDADTDAKIALAKRNYEFSFNGRERIAGRTTLCILADPKASDMPARRYYLDEKSGYPLKVEVVGERGDPKVLVDTIAIDFPSELNREVFRMKPLPGTSTITYTRPKTLTSKAQAQSVVGFRPILPDRLPMGFRVQETQYNGGKEWKSVVVRLNDGLVRATVFQWKPNGKEIEAIEDSSQIDVNGIRLLLVSDLPPHVRMELLQAFAGQAKSDGSPRALRLYGMLVPAVPRLATDPELMAALWTFAQLDSRAGLGDDRLPAGVPVFTTFH